MTSWRRPLAIAEALRRAEAELGPGVELRATVVGDGPARDRLERLLRRHGMHTWVRTPGLLPRTGVRALLRDSDIYLNTTEHEAFGLATLEARIAGVPVVARVDSGVADFITDDSDGLLGRTTSELGRMVARLVRDAELRQRITEHNRSRVPDGFGWAQVLAAYDAGYAEAARIADAAGAVVRETAGNLRPGASRRGADGARIMMRLVKGRA